MIEAADHLLSMIDADTVVVPGHGAVTDCGGLIAFRDMLRSIEDKILAMIEARRGLPQIIAARPTAEFDPLGRGYVTGARFTRMVLAGNETLHKAGSHDMVRILAFSGSSRRDSLNQRLLDQAALGAHAAGAEVTSIRLSDFELPVYDADWQAERGLPNGAEALKALLAGHQGLLIATPEHNGCYTALLKNAPDRMSRPGGFAAGKVGALVWGSPGLRGGMKSQLSLQVVLGKLDALVIPDSFALGTAHQAFDAQGRLRDANFEKAVRGVGAALAATAAKIATSDRCRRPSAPPFFSTTCSVPASRRSPRQLRVNRRPAASLPVVPEPMSVPRAPVSICQWGAVCGPPRRSSPLRAATTCSSCGRSLRAPASITNQRSIPCH
jgi:chromate reductase, NAD(P)H dehydrogenase (quinone)